MSTSSFYEPVRIEEPHEAHEFSRVFSQVASHGQPVIVRRDGEDLAAVVPIEHLDVLRDAMARQEAERLAAQINWDGAVAAHPPAQSWFDKDEPKPY